MQVNTTVILIDKRIWIFEVDW